LDELNAEFWFMLGDLYLKKGVEDQAVDAYVRVTELDPHDPEYG
jgi:cytochrome c-type biogenesis protein CcmH/NrfG